MASTYWGCFLWYNEILVPFVLGFLVKMRLVVKKIGMWGIETKTEMTPIVKTNLCLVKSVLTFRGANTHRHLSNAAKDVIHPPRRVNYDQGTPNTKCVILKRSTLSTSSSDKNLLKQMQNDRDANRLEMLGCQWYVDGFFKFLIGKGSDVDNIGTYAYYGNCRS